MSDEQEHVDVVLEEPKVEAPEEPKIEVTDEKTEKVAKTNEVAPEEGIQQLKRRLEQEKHARALAEQRAHEANFKVQQAYSDVKDSNYQLVSNALETVKGRAEILKNAYRESMAVGDYDKAAEVQQAMIENDRNLAELKRGKKELKKQLAEQEEAQKVQPVAPPMVDPIEQMARAVTPRSASWLRDNRDALSDQRNLRKMFRAHEDAIDDGIEPDSDEYFHFIEQRIGISRDNDVVEAPAPRKSAPPPAAPVSRGGQKPNVIRLSREQAETAKMMGLTEAEYAKNMVALRNEGKLSH
jgi:hypothetical protein